MPPIASRPSGPSNGVRSRTRAALGLLLLPVLLAGASVDPVRAARDLARASVLLQGGRGVAAGDELTLQRTLWDCGPTALHNLLRAMEVESPGPAALARTSGTEVRGTTLAGLVRSARALGVPLRARRPTAVELLALRTPYLAWLGEGHFVTVLAVAPTSRELTVHDPGFGAYRVSLRAFRRRWGGVVADLPHGATPEPASGGSLSALPAPAVAAGNRPPSDRR